MTNLIFVSYRRDDVGQWGAARFARELSQYFGLQSIFFDSKTIGGGEAWAESIDRALRECKAFIPLIGNQWLSPKLGESDDWVRRELQVALSRRIYILPILLDGAVMPKATELPAEIAGLAKTQGYYIDSRSDEIFMASIRVVSGKIKEALHQDFLMLPKEDTCRVTFVRDPPEETWEKYVWQVHLDNRAIMTLEGNETIKSSLISAGHHRIWIQYDIHRGMTYAGQATMSHGFSKGKSEVLTINLKPGEYKFSLKMDISHLTWWQKFLALYESAPEYVCQLSYEPWVI